jgi:hypothetical protein
MTLSVRVIPNNSVSQNWHLVEAFIKSAEEKFGGAEYTTEQIKVYLVQGQWMLLVAVDEDNEIQGGIFARLSSHNILCLQLILDNLITFYFFDLK